MAGYNSSRFVLLALFAAACEPTVAGELSDPTPFVDTDDDVDEDKVEDEDVQPVACTGGDLRATSAAGDCYALFATAATWTAARTQCQALAMDLAKVRDVAENDAVHALIVQNAAIDEVWMGGTDATTEGTWTWADQTAMTYQNWAAGAAGPSNDDQDCMVIETDDVAKEWSDRSCDTAFAFVCHRPPAITSGI